jgi:DNA repair protein RadC
MENGTHGGHRKRLIQKLAQGALLEHEVLEALLFNALPRKNTNDLAHRLLAEFGSVTAVLAAPIDKLTEVDGVGESVAAYLRCIGTFCERYYAEYRERFPQIFDEDDFANFVRIEYTYLEYEVLDCFLIEKSGKILQKKRFSRQAKDFTTIQPEDLSGILATPGVAGIVLVHNHPQQPSTPTAADDDLTKQAQWLCSFHNLILCDHIVCGNEGVYSYYRAGKLETISKNCSIRAILQEGSCGRK